MTRLGRLAVGACALGTLSMMSACATDYIHHPDAFYPVDFETAYAKVADCAKSTPHNNKYVVVYANDTANMAFIDPGVTTYPVGSIFVQAQYDASDCSGVYAALTVMRKDTAGSGTTSDWKWQSVSGAGDIDMEAYDAGGCISCHKAPGGGKDLVKSAP